MIAVRATCLLSLLAFAGCFGSKPERIKPPEIDPAAVGAAAVSQYDTNKDGSVAGAELDSAPALKAALKEIDQDSDQKITSAEVAARIQAWQDSKVAILSLSVIVEMQGKPVEGATVTLTPETFLGSAVQPASGVTDASGRAVLAIANPPRAGSKVVQCGLYRVEISKQAGGAESIPAKYNSKTVLGQEVGPGAAGMATGVKYELSSG